MTAVVPATPSNIGVFQLAVISVLTAGFGVGASDALAYGVILQAIEIATAVALGIPALVREGVTWTDMRLRALQHRAGAPVRQRARDGRRENDLSRPLGAIDAALGDRALLYSQPPMALSNISGFPRIGPNRELKFATEGHWKGEVSAEELLAAGRAIRLDNWRFMQDAGVDLIPSNDFSLYDQVLDAVASSVPSPSATGTAPARSTSTPTSRWRAGARTAAWT